MEIVSPLSISSAEAITLRALIEQEFAENDNATEALVVSTTERLARVQEKLNKLTRSFLDDILDDESFRAAKEELVLEKAALKAQKVEISKRRSGY